LLNMQRLAATAYSSRQPGEGTWHHQACMAGHPSPTSAGWGFYAARDAAKRPDLRFHDLRHTGAVLAAATGATLAELMARLGHSTQGAALRYQHAAADRDLEIARRLSAMAKNGQN
jgi:integrase